MIEAILLAGGKGTRLAPLTDTMPKPIVPIHGKPMMQYVLEHLRKAGIREVAVTVAYLGHMIEDTFGDGSSLGMKLTYLHERELMGTGSWAKLVDWDNVAPEFVVANADNLFWIDLEGFFARHRETAAVASVAAIELPSEHIVNYEIMRPNDDRTRLSAYVHRSQSEQELAGKSSGFINSGWYIMTPGVRDFVDDVLPISNEVHVWPRLAGSGRPLGFYHATEPWFDSGTHERLARVADFIANNPKYVQ